MNPYDELAVEEAIRIKEKQEMGKVTVSASALSAWRLRSGRRLPWVRMRVC